MGLKGTVDSWQQREDAERAIRHLKGVVAVTNNILVRPRTVNTQELREAIGEALERHATREANRVDIEVHDGKVTLSGEVGSWLERRAIVGTVAHAPGVQVVSDQLTIRPYG